MKLCECYQMFHGDYDKVINRLKSDRLVSRFLLKFPNDPSFQHLLDALDAGNTEAAFQAAHTLKGVCGNLELGLLYEHTVVITEYLRYGRLFEAKEMKEELKEDYQTLISAIQAYASTQ